MTIKKTLATLGLVGLAALPAAALAVEFDPEEATQALLSTLSGAARARSDAYYEGGYWLILWGTLIPVLAHWLILHFGLSALLRDYAERLTPRRWLQPALYVLPYVLLGALFTLPWTIYAGYIREKQYGLLSQGFADWAGDQGIGLGIGLAMSAVVITGLFTAIRNSPKYWWFWGAGAASLFAAFMLMIVPVFISPLFNTYSEMQPGPLRERIVAMADTYHVPSDHIYVFDQSKQHKRISANVSGFGPTIRISLNDNLLNRTSPAEVAAVMGHELGHYVLGHAWRSVYVYMGMFLLAFLLTYNATPPLIARYGKQWKVRNISDPAVTPVFVMLTALLLFMLTPITNSLTRGNESAADAFGLDAAREPDGFAETAMKFSEYRKIEPGRIEEMLFFDHPSGAPRIRMAMAWKAKHLSELKPAP